jgi:ABC-type Zn uptake system ZnuABC Zn-binding protein ZnuA
LPLVRRIAVAIWAVVLLGGYLAGCAAGERLTTSQTPGTAPILTDTSFLADIVQQVAGDRLLTESIVPAGADPHSFEPTPRDAERVSEARAVAVNARGLMPTIDGLLAGAMSGDALLIEAAAGLPGLAEDPHCWLDPLAVVTYVENIAGGLALVDPGGEPEYRANAAVYSEALRELDSWIADRVGAIPQERRLLVTNHESLGRFATRYGFVIVGTIFPNSTGEGSPSARQLAELVDSVRAAGAPAIFLETGSNAALAEQLAAETGLEVVTDLYTHSLGQDAPTYLEMMRWNVTKIVEALE